MANRSLPPEQMKRRSDGTKSRMAWRCESRMTARLTGFKLDDRKKVIDIVTCNIEICRVVGLRQSLVEVDMIRFPLITPIFTEGCDVGRVSPNCFNSFTTSTRR